MVAGMTVSKSIVAAIGVSGMTAENPRIPISATLGWKGVPVGLASSGAGTRYRVVGAAAGADGCPPQAEIVNRIGQATFTFRECIVFLNRPLRTLEWLPNRGIL
jgi:hypothetical protein